MLEPTRGRVRRHAHKAAVVSSILGGLYIAGSYAMEKLRESQEIAADERRARDNLRRRFLQNQEDCTFTLLSLLPSLSVQLQHEMDVDALTAQLSQLSKASKASRQAAANTTSSLSSSLSSDNPTILDVSPQGSSQHSSSGIEGGMESSIGSLPESLASGDAAGGGEGEGAGGRADGEGRKKNGEVGPDASDSIGGSGSSWSNEFVEKQKMTQTQEELGNSVISMDSNVSSLDPLPAPQPSHPSSTTPSSPDQSASFSILPPPSSATTNKTKVQLWNELKTLSFTRTLTTLYSLVLLSLLTRTQLNILGKHTYLRSMVEFDRAFFSPSATSPSELADGVSSRSGAAAAAARVSEMLGRVATGASDWLGSAFRSTVDRSDEREGEGSFELDQETEMAYLTFSWWLTHVGWKEIGERVRMAVDEVMAPVSLKKVLQQSDFDLLLSSIRQKVEFDLGGDGIPRPHDFLPHLLPQTPHHESHLLLSTNLIPATSSTTLSNPSSSHLLASPSSPLRTLLSQTTTHLTSPSFSTAFSASLAHAFGSLSSFLLQQGFLGGMIAVLPDQQQEEFPSLSASELMGGAGGGGTFGMDLGEEKGPDRTASTGVVGEFRDGKRLAEGLVGVKRWGIGCFEVGDYGSGNEIVNTLAMLPPVLAYSAEVFASYEREEDKLEAAW